MKRQRDDPIKDSIVWLNLKTTGTNFVLEVACLITDKDLQIKSPCFKAAVHYGLSDLEKMTLASDFAKSGLKKDCLQSPYSLESVESALSQFIKDRVDIRTCVLGGSDLDRTLLDKHLHLVSALFSQSFIDTSSLKEICWRWYPTIYSKRPRMVTTHRALDEVKKSIEIFQWYQKNIFAPPKRNRLITLSLPRPI